MITTWGLRGFSFSIYKQRDTPFLLSGVMRNMSVVIAFKTTSSFELKVKDFKCSD